MSAQFVLELRDVSSLTEARFAAGELFTHIRLSDALASGPEAKILEIKAFLSGIGVGYNANLYESLPAWADYTVSTTTFVQGSQTLSLATEPLADSIWRVEKLELLPVHLTEPAGMSVPGLQEAKLGHAEFGPHQDFLEHIRQQWDI